MVAVDVEKRVTVKGGSSASSDEPLVDAKDLSLGPGRTPLLMLAMTVEQAALTNNTNSADNRIPLAQPPCPSSSRDSVLNQLKEITGVEDIATLEHALEASCNEAGTYNVEQAVNILVDENAVQYKQQPALPAPKTAGPTKKLKCDGVIDLTNETSEKEELQKAIALSLQEQQHGVLGGQVTVEEQDISMVLEQSLAESKVGTKRKRAEVWQDPLNPHERKRQMGWPVGMKNVGNTCWFSAVIQSLFHLPVFRHLVVNFVPPKPWDENAASQNVTERRNLIFMQELRNLFGLMMGTQRKYVDPSKAVEILKEAFQLGSSDNQQDVSEFTHKLLEWLEDAFKSDCSRPASPAHSVSGTVTTQLPSAINERLKEEQCGDRKRNPMLDLFYGQFRSEGLNDGHMFSNEETFGQYPLQVNGFRNIHESLEAATAQEIETNSTEPLSKSGQEHWFTQLPPVLLFELSRFQFNQHLGRPEKIHNHFEFPEVIYMDRYMEVNRNITKTKREEMYKLKERREALHCRLEKYTSYGSGPKRVPLQDVLQYTLEFAENKMEATRPAPVDVEMSSPRSSSSMVADSPSKSPAKTLLPDVAMSCVSSPMSGSLTLSNVAEPSSMTPTPRHISDDELRVLQNCLTRWRTEVETDVKELQDSISAIDDAMSAMYNEPSLQKVPYRLHAVLVHEGQAASGHYWAYIFNHKSRLWLKFNDITVSEASWDELQKESVGGYHNASAYCLMYIDSNCQDLVKELNGGSSVTLSLDIFPSDLWKLVEEDNQQFKKEQEKWDSEQEQQQQQQAQGATFQEDANWDVELQEPRRRQTWSKASQGDEEDNWDLELRQEEEQGHTPMNTSSEKKDASVAGKETEKALQDEPEADGSLVMLAAEHAALAQRSTIEAIMRVADKLNTKGVDEVLSAAMESEVHRLLQHNNSNNAIDARVQNMAAYLMQNGVSVEPSIKWVLLEQFAYVTIARDRRFLEMRRLAAQRLKELRANATLADHRRVHLKWHQDFASFRKTVGLFVAGLQLFHKGCFAEALPYIAKGCALNDGLLRSGDLTRKGLDSKLLTYYRRQCLLNLNDAALSMFELENPGAEDAFQLMNESVVPCMNLLSSRRLSDEDMADNAAAEEIRRKWCSKLGDELTEQSQEQLTDLLSRLLDPGSEAKLADVPPLTLLESNPADLSERLRDAMNLAKSSGFLAAALHTR